MTPEEIRAEQARLTAPFAPRELTFSRPALVSASEALAPVFDLEAEERLRAALSLKRKIAAATRRGPASPSRASITGKHTKGTGRTIPDLGPLPHDHDGDAAHDAMLEVRAAPDGACDYTPSGLALRVRNLPPAAPPPPRNEDAPLFASQERAAQEERLAAHVRDLDVLAGAAARDRGNRRGTWTPEEVAAADRVDDAYHDDDLMPLGHGWYVPDGDDCVALGVASAQRSRAG